MKAAHFRCMAFIRFNDVKITISKNNILTLQLLTTLLETLSCGQLG